MSKSFDEIISKVKECEMKTVAVSVAQDDAVLEAVREAKEKLLDKRLHSVKWDAIHVVEYGTPKENFKLGAEDILFDDEERNRENWGEYSFDPSQIMEILSALG